MATRIPGPASPNNLYLTSRSTLSNRFESQKPLPNQLLNTNSFPINSPSGLKMQKKDEATQSKLDKSTGHDSKNVQAFHSRNLTTNFNRMS